MLGLALGVGLLHILPQPGTELGVGAVLNQDMGPLVGRQAPQIRQAPSLAVEAVEKMAMPELRA